MHMHYSDHISVDGLIQNAHSTQYGIQLPSFKPCLLYNNQVLLRRQIYLFLFLFVCFAFLLFLVLTCFSNSDVFFFYSAPAL